jgi:predicted ribosomally synthesized peptide with nif11-like leader
VSIQAALSFIAAVREDPELRRKLEALAPGSGLDPVAEIGGAAGFAFTAEELRRAHPIDWAMRAARYDRGPAAGDNG